MVTQKLLSSVVTFTSKFDIVYLPLGALPCIYLHLHSVHLLTQFCKAILEFITMSMSSDYTKELSISSRLLMKMLNKSCPYSNPKYMPLVALLRSDH